MVRRQKISPQSNKKNDENRHYRDKPQRHRAGRKRDEGTWYGEGI